MTSDTQPYRWPARIEAGFRRWAVTAGLTGFVASPSVRRRPHQLYRALRSMDPVHESPFGIWVLSRHEDVAAALRHPLLGNDETKADFAALRGVRKATGALGRRQGAWSEGGAYGQVMHRLMLFRDPPDHTRLRSLVARAFTPRRVADLEGRVAEILDELLEKPAKRGRIELMRELAYPLPARVISELLGVPNEHESLITDVAPALAVGLDPGPMRTAESVAAADRATARLVEFLDELIHERKCAPGDDLLSGLIEAEDDGDHLSHDELVSTVALLLIAGHETTANLIGNSLYALLRDPASLELLRIDPSVDRLAIEELLRHSGPIQMAERITLESVTIAGVTIPAGRIVVPLIAAANRDPEVFKEPGRLDLSRDPNPHLAFSAGAHYCIGAALARLEGRIAVATICRRFPTLSVTGRPVWRSSFTIRGLRELELALR